ncbi:MAG: hypothetical protein A3I61_02010 [Acidobacteria bacterium RIFCSPLOWO2_02_FULL_68_18]|nr:MAG: hypothetical protein A3I61_02010 [Acidobacteria bacterium RIFCSPLOWO2_02_FULL_68_18]OFW50251.1 MAG: hypothetical protein A3G77_09790 [Acidobacteria bacterium RIFCSPLOWO2_12_FULL_68_19]
MPQLLHDRYFAYDSVHGCDLATGDEVRLDRLPAEGASQTIPALAEVLSDAQDGAPRRIVAEAATPGEAAILVRRAAAEARARGFVPILASLYVRLRDGLAAELEDRTLLLIDGFGGDGDAARSALLEAAARSPRPHVLLTFRGGPGTSARRLPEGCVVREARAAYGPRVAVRESAAAASTPDVARHLLRASRAEEFQRSGRHAAAERLLRDVAGALIRRQARLPAAETLLMLGRALLERGRAAAADTVFAEAAQLAEAGPTAAVALDARLWQALARTDAGRLTDAESICRAVLLTETLAPERQAWASAALARVLCWQGRAREVRGWDAPAADAAEPQGDPVVAASTEATAVRLLLATGDVFQAGQRARLLVTRTDHSADPLIRAIAFTAHLRVLVAAGDLHLAAERVQEISALARAAHAPLRAARARLIWHLALRRAGRAREAGRELQRLSRFRRVAPVLLRRAIDVQLGDTTERPSRGTGVLDAQARTDASASLAVSLVHLVHEEDSDRRALERLLQRVADEVGPSRVDLVTADAGPPSAVLSAGTGLPTRLGVRVLEAGILIASELEPAGREVGLPVRCAGRLLAALVCRWPIDRQPPTCAVEVLNLAAAVAAPRVDAFLTDARETAGAATAVPELLGVSAAMAEVRRAIERAARAPFAVLVEGESGVGKELAARAIHQLSPRRERRFCDVNCAALPDELVESELFGHARGAFTGAVVERAGLFEEADGGTVFLDEVADLSPRGQAKLLRVVQQQEVRRIGESFARPIDVRLVTAANRDMRAEVAAGRFREDLLYRLDVIRIRIPPLGDRPEDIAVLAQHFWRAAAGRVGSAASLGHEVLGALARYHWPGNVRELQNVLAALAVAAPPRGRVRASLLPVAITGATAISSRTLVEARAQFERRLVEAALARAAGSRTRAAVELGLSRQGLVKTMARLGLGAAKDSARLPPPED